MGAILLLILIVLLVGSVPAYEYNRNWGHNPSRLITLLIAVLLVLMILNQVPWWFGPGPGTPVGPRVIP